MRRKYEIFDGNSIKVYNTDSKNRLISYPYRAVIRNDNEFHAMDTVSELHTPRILSVGEDVVISPEGYFGRVIYPLNAKVQKANERSREE